MATDQKVGGSNPLAHVHIKDAGSLRRGIPAFFRPLTEEGKQRKINTKQQGQIEQKAEEMTWIEMNL